VSWEVPGGGRQTITTPTPTQVVRKLACELATAKAASAATTGNTATADCETAEIPGLTVTRPTLEDVYLELIGSKQ
jgi:hypothetical protein